ncbi:MAG: GlxA family transcriptional regulator [Rhodospirillales bacterium]|nr:MAG: GlxA family transcriptional regulator [Rhodospirillales bacterium]
MFRKVSGERPDRVSFLLIPNFSMSAFTAMLEAMRLANYTSGRTLYEWEVLSRDGDAVEASNGVQVIADKGIADVPHLDNVVVCSGIGAQLYQDNVVFGWLRRWAREGAHVGGLCTAAHVLAHAGLLKGYRCTIHWENLEGFREQHPELDVQAELFEVDRDRFTCAGGIAAADMMLTEVARRHGDEIASAVSEQFMHERIREGHDNQRLPLQARLRISHPKLIQAIAEMESYVEEALSREEIADRVGLSRRQLERLFRRYLNTSPARYYLRLRLERARLLLTQTTMPVTEIAFACGFTSASHFSKCYRDMFGRTPRDQRRTDDGAEQCADSVAIGQ